MKGLNRAYLIGHIGQEPEMHTSRGGQNVLKLSLATPNVRKVNEEWVDTPDWHRITVFGNDAEYLGKYAHKGDALAVECAIRPNKWTDKDNIVHHDVNLIVEKVAWLGSKNRPSGGDQGGGGPPRDTRPAGGGNPAPGDDDAIPF